MSRSRFFVWSLMFGAALLVQSATLRAQAEKTPAATVGATGHSEAGHAQEIGNPTDGDASEILFKTVDFREDMAIFTAIVFLLLLAGLYVTAWKPIMEGLEKREHTIAGNISAAQTAVTNAQLKLKEYEAKLAGAAEEATRMVAEARKDAEVAGARIVAAAQDEAARQRERGVAEIESAKRIALSELASKSTDVAMTLAQRIVGREVKSADHQNLIQDMLSQLPSKN
jgi:F-type H+-transporting ATPase subunit b